MESYVVDKYELVMRREEGHERVYYGQYFGGGIEKLRVPSF
jgi:hypothetical protein